jgi:WD repeat-containing protein 22
MSIVNSTLIHPHIPHIFTSGIERHILLHSPTPFSPCTQNLTLTSPEVRKVPSLDIEERRRIRRTLFQGDSNSDSGDELDLTDREMNTIARFDE